MVWMKMREDDIRNVIWRNPSRLKQTINLVFLLHLHRSAEAVIKITEFAFDLIMIARIVENITVFSVFEEIDAGWKDHFLPFLSLKEQGQIAGTIASREVLNAFDNLGHTGQFPP